MNWHLQDAKNNLSKVVRKAVTEGPQIVTVRGEPTVAVISMEEYRRTHPEEGQAPKMDFVQFLLSGPPWDDETVELVNQRSKIPSREIDLCCSCSTHISCRQSESVIPHQPRGSAANPLSVFISAYLLSAKFSAARK